MKRNIFAVGAFPPPVHGMSIINQAVFRLLEERKRNITIIDIAAPSLARGLYSHIVRARRAFGGLRRLWAARKTDPYSLYMSVSGGYGQLHEILYVLLARMHGAQVILHHHSYAYLDHRRPLTRLLFMAAPADTRHVVLSTGMSTRLRQTYGVDRVQVLSNAAFMPDSQLPPAQLDRPLGTVGFLSNISAEKGIYDFLALMQASHERGLGLKALIAGPFQDKDAESRVMSLLRDQPYVHYVGPKYGAEKEAFYAALDVLVFPTRYANEAEPVTIHEALTHGVPVIAFGRGAIPEILDGPHGVAIPPDQDFARAASKTLLLWKEDAAAFRNARRCCLQRSHDLHAQSRRSLDELLDSL